MEGDTVTKPLHYDNNGTPFGRWLRKQRELDSKRFHLSIQNIDYANHRFKVTRNSRRIQAMMLLEEKRYLAESDFAQLDTLMIIDQVFKYADGIDVVNYEGETLPFHYFGLHTIQFENTTPDDGYVLWNGVLVDRNTLCKLLRFELDPRLLGVESA
jgi:hypothetical protein